MKRQIQNTLVALVMTIPLCLGCAAKATDEKIDEMCTNYLKVTGISKSTDEAAEVARITKEYEAKGKKLRDEIDRDIKGQQDVYNQRIADLEKTDVELTEEEIKQKVTTAQKKDSLIAKYTAEFEKNKKGFEDDFDKFFAKIAPRRDREIADSKAYVKARKEKADKAMAKCVKDAKNSGVSDVTATCRVEAKVTDQYNGCQ